MSNKTLSVKTRIEQRIKAATNGKVWTPVDFIDLGSSTAIDKTLQRMVINNQLRRIDRGLYDLPEVNSLTGKYTVPDYWKIIEAVARRDQIHVLLDGLTCANELGLTNAVLGKVVVHTDGRLRSIRLDNLIINFKLTAQSKLYWADRPGMRIVQALYWLNNSLKGMAVVEQKTIQNKLIRYLQNAKDGRKICNDLQKGLHTIPVWMQIWIRALLDRYKTTGVKK